MDLAIGLIGTPQRNEVAAIVGDRVYPLAQIGLAGNDLPTVLAGGDAMLERIEVAVAAAGPGGSVPLAGAGLRAPITPASKIVCLGDAFISHLIAGNDEIPEAVGVFYKMTQDVIGPGESIVIPRNWKGRRLVAGTEMALVIGRRGRYIPPEQVWDHVWGYTILNDVTLKKMAPNLGPTNKVFETSSPVGPYLVPKRAVPDPRSLALLMRINGREVQRGHTSDMRFEMAESVSEVSNWHTLEPGDIIATADIGSTDWLEPGDEVECEVEGVGILANSVRQD